MLITKGKLPCAQFLTEHLWLANCHPTKTSWSSPGFEINREDLLADWDLAVNGKKPFPIKGLDQ
jgi:hypothetical protein